MSVESRVVLETKWFNVVAKAQRGDDPYYMLELPDYVCVVAITASREVLLVRQHAEPRVGEALLQLADLAADRADAEHGPFAQAMNSERSWRSWALPLAPTIMRSQAFGVRPIFEI